MRRLTLKLLRSSHVRELEKAVEESGATVTIGSLPPVHANEEQLLRLFQNLVGNAIKYRGKNSPKIHISASLVEGELIFSVSRQWHWN